MPEGHVLHGLARKFNAAFLGETVNVTSPQGRFAESAALLNQTRFVGSEAFGKQLFIEFDADIPEPIIYIHLGLIGHFRLRPLADPVGVIRLRISDDEVAADLSGPQICRLVSPEEKLKETSKLGADPLRIDADPEIAWNKIHRSAKPIASLLMNQGITAGVGNIYRAEVLFRARVNPWTPGNELRRSSWEKIWADLVELMPHGVISGNIDTVEPEHSPEVMDRPPRKDAHGGEVYVYRRAGLPCYVCGSRIRCEQLENRQLYWCGRCQRRK